MKESIWRLPGPGRLVGQITQEVKRGRHAVAVLPAPLTADEALVDGLVTALMQDLSAAGEEPRRSVQADQEADPLHWLAQSLIFGDDLPSTVADLLDHEDAAGMTAVLNCAGLGPEAGGQVAALMARIALESRPRPAIDRPRIVVVGSRHVLPTAGSGSTDLTLAPTWWWGRLTRWDVASHLAPLLDLDSEEGVLRDIRLETLIEVCRWDIDLAEHLARCWDGDPASLPAAVKEIGYAPPIPPRLPVSTTMSHRRPPDNLLDDWDRGGADLWHGEACASPRGSTPAAVDTAVWAAQARVLLPWIEMVRQRLISRVRYHGDPGTINRAIAGLTSAPNRDDLALLEIGPLFVVTRAVLGRGQRALVDAAWRLKDVRNKLAHLQTLSLLDQRELITACAML